MEWKKVKISSFLKERTQKYTPEEANNLGLKRLNKIDFSGTTHLIEKPTNTNMILIKKGDLVISGINVGKGAIAIYREEEDIMATIHYSSYQFDEEIIDIDYFKFFLRSKVFKKIVNTKIKGGIKTELKAKKFLPLEILIPSLKSQKEIVKKINSYNKEIKEVKEIYKKNRTLIKKLSQNIVEEIIEKEDGELKKLDDICKIRRGASPRPIKAFLTEKEDGINWIKIGDTVKGNKYLESTNQRITPEGAEKSVKVSEGDLIMSNSMSFGEPYILKTNGCIHDGWLTFEFDHNLLSPDFFYLILLSGQKFFKSKAKGMGVKNLNIPMVKEMEVKLPKKDIQEKIVKEINNLKDMCRKLDEMAKIEEERAGVLMDVKLSECFKG